MGHGLSVVICCHNSSKLLPRALDCLLRQKVSKDIPWEVIVVDNASTDNTSRVALTSWSEDAPAPLRVVREGRLGLIHARYRGLKEARYELIGFIDHDNWVAPDWVETATKVMNEHPEAGACGGFNEAVFESEPPEWFESCRDSYAVGPQGEPGDITEIRGRLVGAGLIIRKKAWQQLINLGFRSMLTGHKGNGLSRGEDSELCYALCLAGWRLWYEPGLRLKHYLASDRLRWGLLRRIRRSGEKANVILDPYWWAFEKNTTVRFKKLKQDWRFQSLLVTIGLLGHPIKLFTSFFSELEGDGACLLIEKKIGRLLGLLKRRGEHNRDFEKINRIFIQ